MRFAALSLFAFALAACGGVGGDVTAPAEAPEGVPEIAGEAFKICAAAINSGSVDKALALAATLEWDLENAELASKVPIDLLRTTMMTKAGPEHRIQFFEHDGPNETYIGCQLIVFGKDQFVLNPSLFDEIPGFDGRSEIIREAGQAMAMGHWSKRSGNSVLSMQVAQEGAKFSMLAMNKRTLK